jgi:menaquinone-9 beta-reductase
VDLDLVIVGGGPAGVATALFLVDAAPHLKDRIAILEKERYPREKICAGAIGARADKLLATIGVRVDVPSVWIHGLSVATALGSLHTRDASAPSAIGRVVRRIEFDRALADEARARGVRIVEGARVVGLDFDASGARVHSTQGEIRARAVVGADGVGSFVRRALGAPRGRWLAHVAEVDTRESSSPRPRDLLHFDLTDPSLFGYAWDFPTLVDGEALVCRGIYELRPDRGRGSDGSSHDGAASGVDLGARLDARLAALGLSSAGLRVKRFAERGLALHEPLARPGALLVGEAAGIDPVLGEGIAQAILYGAAAGRYLARAFARGDLSFSDWPRALLRSRVGFDLRIRTRAPALVYGVTRRSIERWVTSSSDLALAGMRYFAGEHVPRRRLAVAAVDLGRALVSGVISSRPWRAWW